MSLARALTIAGSDSGGGAGIQADLRTFAMHCVHGMTALTCVTAQNTVGVQRVEGVSPELVKAQIQSVLTDIGVDAAKTGMLLNTEIMHAVADTLELNPIAAIVVDPVMVARTGAVLIDQTSIAVLRDRLLPKALITTPNRYEAQILAEMTIETVTEMQEAARIIQRFGPKNVLVKGGGLARGLQGTDVWFDGTAMQVLVHERVDTPHTHGTGCTLAAAMTANLAQGYAPLEAVQRAKHYVTQALHHALAIGQGTGPVGHFFPLLV
ncbi:MAG: bifunctional hydroxymethylpyrimidine kinase/phosphomethylpyrimidine kinase [Spirulina sp. SIO3F2]|nr:bifunctional hydroxymethylpyrimidine kinase/phosphomethylpyrimidine kinase [Spirulina sp. SIO3F2]